MLRFGRCGCREELVPQGRAGAGPGVLGITREEQEDHSPLLGTQEPCPSGILRGLGRSSCSTGRARDRIRAGSTENRDAALCGELGAGPGRET